MEERDALESMFSNMSVEDIIALGGKRVHPAILASIHPIGCFKCLQCSLRLPEADKLGRANHLDEHFVENSAQAGKNRSRPWYPMGAEGTVETSTCFFQQQKEATRKKESKRGIVQDVECSCENT